MATKKNKLMIVGAVLVIIQYISIFSIFLAEVGLYPGDEHLKQDGHYYSYAWPAYFETKMIPVAINAGLERFVSSFRELFVANKSDRILSPAQHKSAVYRASLYLTTQHYGGQGIYIYDSILTISYSIVGITGFGLLIAGIITEVRKLKKQPTD